VQCGLLRDREKREGERGKEKERSSDLQNHPK
jgi:hypothetical protein